MRKLLSAGFLRLRKNRMFYILLLSMFGLGLFLVFGKYSDMVNYGAEGFLDDFIPLRHLQLPLFRDLLQYVHRIRIQLRNNTQ